MTVFVNMTCSEIDVRINDVGSNRTLDMIAAKQINERVANFIILRTGEIVFNINAS